VFLNIFLSAVCFCFNTESSDKCDITVYVSGMYCKCCLVQSIFEALGTVSALKSGSNSFLFHF